MKKYLVGAALFGASGVLLGALGAHALEEVLSSESLESFKTGVRYQMFHALAMLAWMAVSEHVQDRMLRLGLQLMSWGTVLFSVSIYFLATRSATGLSGLSWLGPVTPLGGLLLITAWVVLLTGAWKGRA
jgi:uncharacterized membrane protein YgdD (TMEM256/DUF423 family)